MSFKKYKFEEYKPEYKERFRREKKRIKEALPDAKIEHVGSTAVPGLGGKGIIDMAIWTPKEKLNEYMEKLHNLGYEYKPKPGDEERKFLQKVPDTEEEGRFHVHLTLHQNFWDSFIALRDYLRENRGARDKYEELKKKAVKKGKEKQEYREHKEKFLEKLVKKALKRKKNR